MHPSHLERELLQSAGAVICDPRLVRRIIKQHRGVTGPVPHGRCYGLSRAVLDQLVAPGELTVPVKQLPDEVVLLSRPSPREMTRLRQEVATRLWRNVFHARIHLALEKRIKEGGLELPVLRQRIDQIGQTEFDEIRGILRHDELVMPPGDDREVYVEFAALFLELRYFAPDLLLTTFVGIAEPDRVRAVLSEDIDVAPLLEQGRPSGVIQPEATRVLAGTSMPSFSAPATFGVGKPPARTMSPTAHGKVLERAKQARAQGNDVRAALLCAQAANVLDPDLSKKAQSAEREALLHLGERLTAALADPEQRERRQDWSLLLILGARAAEERVVRYTVEARLLYTLQRAAVEFEKGQRKVDVWAWIQSFGKRPVVRELPATRELNVARLVHAAAARVRNVRIGDADRKLLARLLHWASDRAEANVRRALRPRILTSFDQVGLRATSGPELLARNKVIEELLDFVTARGYLSYDALRDTLSRNQLKLDDLSGPRELWVGDPLVKADAALADALDGIYRKSDIYLRGLQKVSSLPFGTKIGRALFLYLILPFGGSAVALEGLEHMINPIMRWVGGPHVDLLHPISFVGVAAVILALLHSSHFRAFAMQLLEIIALVLATIFFRVPRAILTSSFVRAILAQPSVRFAIRRVLLPLGLGTAAYLLAPVGKWYFKLPIAIAFVTFSSMLLGSRLGAILEDFVVDQLAPTWQVVSRQWLPGLLRLISRFFDALADLLLRAMVRVDEVLRFREGQSSFTLVTKGATGFVWAIVAYVIRLYFTLLIEPEINPLKHFPVVTVAQKMMLTATDTLVPIVMTPLKPLGSVIAGTVGGLTLFLLPSVFGFLAWELKENFRLYRATRPERIPPAPVGRHGETMRGLLVVGLHSGTLPKLYERLRRAAQREDEVQAPGQPARGTAHGISRFRDGLREIEQGVWRFVDRELCALLRRSPRWRMGSVDVDAVFLSSNRVRVRLVCASATDQPVEITFEEQSGLVVAGVARNGFIDSLAATPDAGVLFENALAGLYQLAEVDLVREQIEIELGQGVQYDIADDGLVVWPLADYRTELVYALGRRFKAVNKPKIRGEQPGLAPPIIDTRRMAFREQGVAWVPWVAAWSAAESPDLHIPRLLAGASILPPPAPPGADRPQLSVELSPRPPEAMPTVAAAPLIAVAVTQPIPTPASPEAPPLSPVIHTQPMPATTNED